MNEAWVDVYLDSALETQVFFNLRSIVVWIFLGVAMQFTFWVSGCCGGKGKWGRFTFSSFQIAFTFLISSYKPRCPWAHAACPQYVLIFRNMARSFVWMLMLLEMP